MVEIQTKTEPCQFSGSTANVGPGTWPFQNLVIQISASLQDI